MNDIHSLTPTELKLLEAHGIIEVRIKPAYRNKDISHMEVTELEEFKPFKHLIGKGISISEAERKYDISNQTISNWAKNGRIPTLGMDKNRKLVDEAYVAYYSNKYHAIAKSGRRTDRLLFG